jgi:hypothetical protein
MSLSRGLSVTLALWTLLAGLSPLEAAEVAAKEDIRLLMVEERGCRYCMRWDAEVGKVYGKTPEGRRAPLVRIGRRARELRELAPVVYTPTFILSKAGEEIGRITGYPGESYFWEELAGLLAAAGPGLNADNASQQ